ncbi:Hsp20/alpha crystallin family protein [Nitrosospira multiformis]|uniref:Heat shock protein Hsp20 n=1 Tax=Nitrosospira multiformis (strain ATCC 25196 / NCIMB 11849 / C 71) TaxID=323848 RepID=Q2Y9U8_NITMU|nr:Hsp20/alpha crystallin family protein [Nitrosospira multiformis]ABB74473.1 heat shock protein Hsp20 [Nitrosospira multiformis ATCC 25196]SEA25197.1 heat shock protein Hsp20 [Nitrosospira multiformis]SEF77023.1 heat shock protein Hsp20 [Nitrosospira multiformis ATCC 25196]
MMDSVKNASENISRRLSRTWDHISDGWRELVHHGSDALTHFVHRKGEEDKGQEAAASTPAFPRWSILAGDMEETDREIVVRIEVPGMEKKDFEISIEGKTLSLRGEKRFERDTNDSKYHVMERAYGVFQRTLPLPVEVNEDKAEADYKNGVLTVRLPKLNVEKRRFISIS